MGSQLLMIAIGAWAMAMVRVVREPGRFGAYYLYVLLAIGALLVVGVGDGLSRWGLAGVVLTGISVLLPFVLDILSRALWDRSKLDWAARLASLRGHLLLGGAAMLQAEIWRALAKFPGQGASATVQSLRDLKQEWDGPGARVMLEEQVLGVYAMDGQWGLALMGLESSASDPLYVHRVGAALRMRAYLEEGRFENAAAMLSDVCGSDSPSPFSLRVQWVFLAMTGAAPVERLAMEPEVQRSLGMSPASTQLWLAIFYRAKGERAKAKRALDASLTAHGLQRVFHERMVQVVRDSLDDFQEPDWPEQMPSVQAGVLQDFERACGLAPKLSNNAPSVLALCMIGGLLARLLAVVYSGGSVDALLEWGAMTPATWANGAWWRVFTAPYLMLDLFGWLIVAYLWWISAMQGPSRVGAFRWVTALLLVPSLSLALMALVSPAHAGAAASSMALVAAITAALWSGPQGLTQSGRTKGWTLVIGLLLLAKLAGAALDPGGGPVAAMGMLVCAALVSLLLGLRRNADLRRPSWAARVLVGAWVLAWPLIRWDPGPAALVQAKPLHCSALGLDWELPARFHVPHEALARTSLLPKLQGWIDAGAWQGRARVQLGVLARPEGLGPNESSVEAAWPKEMQGFSLTAPGISLPEPLVARRSELRVRELRQEGTALALLVERDLPASAAGTPQTVVLLWQPRRPSQSYAPSQLQALFSARSSLGKLPHCPGEWPALTDAEEKPVLDSPAVQPKDPKDAADAVGPTPKSGLD